MSKFRLKSSVLQACFASAFLLGISACSATKGQIAPEVVNFAMPQGGGQCTLVIQPLHEYLAEFSYHLIVRPVKGPDSEFDLMFQCGGQPEMKFFFYPRSQQGGPYLQIFHLNGTREFSDLINIRTGIRIEKSETPENYEKRLKEISIVKPIYIGSISKQLKFVAAE